MSIGGPSSHLSAGEGDAFGPAPEPQGHDALRIALGKG